MSFNGFFPPHPCKNCGKMLDYEKTGEPSNYAGSSQYTGECYSCNQRPSFILKTLVDGCNEISFPAHNPSYRRQREEFHAYPNCDDCGGQGHKIAYSSGWSYREYCKTCFDRYYAFPLRKTHQDFINYLSILRNYFNKKYAKKYFAGELKPKDKERIDKTIEKLDQLGIRESISYAQMKLDNVV